MGRKSPEWLEFEKTVAALAKSLLPRAKVTHNAKLPDRHTRKRRQRDVWIELGGHFPINILVSCKRYKRRLHQHDIDVFHGELMSSHAHKGILYSYSTFGGDAIKKAQALGITCCRLYKDQPADVPESLIINTHFCCDPTPELVYSHSYVDWGLKTLADLFALTVSYDGKQESMLDAIANKYIEVEKTSIAGMSLPLDMEGACRVEADGKPPLVVTVRVKWNYFVAGIEAITLDGSYSVTHDHFVGSQAGPSIDMKSKHPGPAWRRLDKRPPDPTGNVAIVSRGYASAHNVAKQFAAGFGPMTLADAKKVASAKAS